MENFLVQGFFNAQRLSEFKAYVEALPDDSVAPKLRLTEVIERMEEEQKRIAQIEARARLERQGMNQFLNGTLDDQAQTLADAEMIRMARQEVANMRAGAQQ